MIFQFKQFNICQEVNPHKVGTDSVLLGAWTKTNAMRILDVGTGTGLLALMGAQNHPLADVVAIDSNPEACKEAEFNVERSRFANRIGVRHSRLQDFQSSEKFDLIISNPPYFSRGLLPTGEGRTIARHQHSLSIAELYSYVARLLDNSGIFSLIFPYSEESLHLQFGVENGLSLQKVMRTNQPSGNTERILAQWGKSPQMQLDVDEILVKDHANRYSTKYIELTKEFYLKDLSEGGMKEVTP